MSTAQPAIRGAEAAQDAAQAWQKVRGDPTLQFAPVDLGVKQTDPPGWLKAIGEFLRMLLEPIGKAMGLSWPVLQWVLLGVLVLFVLYALWRMSETLRLHWQTRSQAAANEAPWRPDVTEAMALLDDADRLAGEGRFDEAVHLLLKRAMQQIASARPEWVRRASTAREIAATPELPQGARDCFARIASLVERSLFALRGLGSEDWKAARAAYSSFALARLPDGGPA